jgi:hypothetical protein
MKITYRTSIFILLLCSFGFSFTQRQKEALNPSQAWADAVFKATEATAILVAKYVASELSLDPIVTNNFVNAYVQERLAAAKRREEIRYKGNRQSTLSVSRMDRVGYLRVLRENLSPAQRKIATSIMRPDGRLGGSLTGSLDGSVNRLVRARITKRKIMKTMPIIVEYLNQFVDLERISGDERMDKVIELRVATAKKMVPIIGVDAADSWLDLRRRKGITIK